MKQTIRSDNDISKWRLLYKISGILAIVMALIIPLQVIIFSFSFPPESVVGWFELYHKSWILGLIHMDLLFTIDNVIIAIMYLALYFTLRRNNESLMIVAIILGLLGLSAYFSSNKAFEMLSISNQYYNAAANTDKSVYLAVGQMLIESWRGTAFLVYYVLNGITLLMIAGVMFRSDIYSKKTAIVGLIAGIFMVIPSTAGTIGLVFSLLSLIPWMIFTIMVAIKFLKLSKG